MADNKRSPEKRSIDQPSKYDDPKIQKVILDALADGNYLYVAAHLAGVHPDTLHEWIKRGHRKQGPPALIEFVEQIDLALAKWEAETVKVVHEVAQSGQPNTWQAAMTMLERRSPGRWGKRDRIEVEADKPLLQLNQIVLANEEVRGASREFLRLVTSLPALPAADDETEGVK